MIKKITLIAVTLFTLLACNNKSKNENISKLSIDSNYQYSDDFSRQNSKWSVKKRNWIFKDKKLTQNATKYSFPLILLEDKPLSSVDISIDFKPISGKIDASGGIVFRAKDKDNYYIVRANALEGNFRLYTFKDGYRSEIASATVKPPTLGKVHTIRVVAKGDTIQAYLDGKLELNHKDSSFKKGYTGLWTKADSVTEFDNFKVIGN